MLKLLGYLNNLKAGSLAKRSLVRLRLYGVAAGLSFIEKANKSSTPTTLRLYDFAAKPRREAVGVLSFA